MDYEFDAPRFAELPAEESDAARAAAERFFDEHTESPADVADEDTLRRRRDAFLAQFGGGAKGSVGLGAEVRLSAASMASVATVTEKNKARYNLRNRSKPLTVPNEFRFARPPPAKSKLGIDKTRGGAVQKKRPAVTVPKPFNLREAKKQQQPASPYVALAERLKQAARTPERFKARPKKTTKVKALRAQHELTRPQSPRLRTKARGQQHGALKSSEQLELERLKSEAPFRARPVDRRVLESAGDLGVPKVAKRRAPTVPESPAITKSKKKAGKVEEAPLPKKQPRARRAPGQEYELPGDRIHAQKQAELAEAKRRRDAEDKKMKQFRARPLPSDMPSQLPPANPKPLTEPVGFHLATDARHALHAQRLGEKLAHDAEKENAALAFYAQPLPAAILDAPTFVPTRSERPVTVPDAVALRTDARAEERRVFDDEQRAREHENEVLKQAQQKEKEERDQLEIRSMRKRLVHHAQPILKGRPVQVKRSQRALTVPHSPMIGKKRQRK